MVDPDRELLLLDPSMFLGEGGFGWLADAPYDERARFVISSTFFDQLIGEADYTSQDEQLWGPLPVGPARDRLISLVADLPRFTEADAAGGLAPGVGQIADQLRAMGSQVAVEEWLYLHTNSWLAARTKKIAEHFRRAAAKVIEVAGIVADDLVLLASGVRAGSRPVTPALRIRAAINVVIVGGLTTASIAFPALAVAIPIAVVQFAISPYLAAPA